jgi:REP element-mobilizing transposase RayT
LTFPGVFPGLSTDETFGRVPPRYARVHKMLVIRPRYAVSWVIGPPPGRNGAPITRRVSTEIRRNFVGQTAWVRGHFVSTIGSNEEVAWNHNRNQEQETSIWR